MTLDARSKERLEALGRTLPRPLPPPDRPRPSGRQTTGEAAGAVEQGRHRVEQEQDPAALFHALMQASPDGHVPPHLLDRLRALEGSGQRAPEKGREAPRSREVPRSREGRQRGAAAGNDDLYAAFAQLLLEDSDE